MTATQNTGMAPREDAAFTFTANGTRFYPQSGARLSYASRTAATLFLPGLPAGLVKPGDAIAVTYRGSTVFAGNVEKFSERSSRGIVTVDATCLDGWGILERRVFRQSWAVRGTEAVIYSSSPRVVLNVDENGVPITLADQLKQVCTAGSLSMKDGGIPEITLPADEARDITCADAIRRLLRLFPQIIARYDSASGGVSFTVPASTDAAYVAESRIMSRVKTMREHPIVGVDISTQTVDSVIDTASGSTLDTRSFTHQTAGDVESDDCLHVFMPLASGSASGSWETLEVKTEDIPANLNGAVAFWKSKHPRLEKVAASSITIYNASRSSTKYKRITSNDIGALGAFGLKAEKVRFECNAKIRTGDDVEEDLFLTMDFIMTDASNGSRTRQTGSSSTSGEGLPEGLAQAILDQRMGSLESEELEIALGRTFPAVGDTLDGLVCQAVEVDCDTLVARVSFGHPEYLSPEDMRNLLTGFRVRTTVANVPLRGSPDPAGNAEPIAGGVHPLSTTEFSPGTKAKTTIKSSGNSNSVIINAEGGGGSVKIDSKDVPDGETAKFIPIKIPVDGSEDGEAKTYTVLAVEGEASGGGEEEDETEEDPHDTEDPHGDDTDACNPGGGSDSPDGSGGGGGAGAAAAADDGVVPSHGTEGGAGVDAGENPGTGSSSPGCDC